MSGDRKDPTPRPTHVREGRCVTPSPEKGRDGEGFDGSAAEEKATKYRSVFI
jgi:hypothetical protein